MYNILANKFMDFLTDAIPETKIPIWVALVAATVLIVIVAIIILVCVGKKSKKNAAVVADVTPTVSADNNGTDDEIVFEQVEEPIMMDEIINAPIIEEPKAVEELKPVENPPIVVAKPSEEPKAVVQQPMATTIEVIEPIAKPMVKIEEPAEEKVVLPERGIDTTEVKMIAKPMTKPAELEKADTARPISEPIAKPVVKATPIAKPVAKQEPKITAAPIAKPVVKATPTAKPVVKAEPIAKPAAKPVAKAEPIAKPAVKPAAKSEPVAKLAAKPVAKSEPIKKVEVAKEPEIKVLDDEKETFGKYLIRDTSSNPGRPFTFELVANNGQLLFESEPFKQKPRQASIDAFKKHVKEGIFVVDEDKQGTFRYKLYSNKNVLMGVGETYKTKASCENSIESVKRFSESATIIEDKTAQ